MASSNNGNGYEKFGGKLSNQVSKSGKNVFLSPASIALAMSMCTAGAKRATLDQMLKTLNYTSVDDLNRTAQDVMEIILSAGEGDIKLKLANRLYAQKNYHLLNEYVDNVKRYYSAQINQVDFESNGASAVQEINQWVESMTNNLIKNLLSPDDVKRDTRLILVNCIYFKGTWEKQFKEQDTKVDQDFHLEDNSTSKIKLMYQKQKYLYFNDTKLKSQIAHIPYKSGDKNEFVFTIVLPDKGVKISDIERQVNDNNYEIFSENRFREEEMHLYLPKFKMECSFDLNEALISLGMKDAFSSSADFSGITDDKDGLIISKVIHKAFIEVNEEGSEAAAATAVVMMRCCAVMNKPQPIEFKCDRPFLFMIRENKHQITLFTGKYLSPP